MAKRHRFTSSPRTHTMGMVMNVPYCISGHTMGYKASGSPFTHRKTVSSHPGTWSPLATSIDHARTTTPTARSAPSTRQRRYIDEPYALAGVASSRRGDGSHTRAGDARGGAPRLRRERPRRLAGGGPVRGGRVPLDPRSDQARRRVERRLPLLRVRPRTASLDGDRLAAWSKRHDRAHGGLLRRGRRLVRAFARGVGRFTRRDRQPRRTATGSLGRRTPALADPRDRRRPLAVPRRRDQRAPGHPTR